jgi:hypothetical protein
MENAGIVYRRHFLLLAFINVKFNGGSKFAGSVKIRGFDNFRDVNQKRVDTVLGTVAH